MKGHIAVNSVLRDWIKGYVTAVEIAMLSFDGAFLFMLPSGEIVLERVTQHNLQSLPPP